MTYSTHAYHLSPSPAPAIVEPGDNTTSDIDEDEFRFFQSQCAAFSDTIMIEQIDLVGRCSLYASSSVQNPGPLDPHDVVVRNETHSGSSRFVHLTLAHIAFAYRVSTHIYIIRV